MMRALAILAVAVAAACATAGGGANNGGDASNERFDAPADAAPGSGGQICSVNGDCPDSGTCCFVAICVPGTGIGSDLCFPSN